ILRKARPHVPIILVEDRSYANSAVLPGPRQHNLGNRAALRKAYLKMVYERVASLHYQPGEDLIGDDGEATVDRSSPADLGLLHHAHAIFALMGSTPPAPPVPWAVIEGYTAQLSYQAADTIRFHVSCARPKFVVAIARLGAERTVVWSKGNMAGKE